MSAPVSFISLTTDDVSAFVCAYTTSISAFQTEITTSATFSGTVKVCGTMTLSGGMQIGGAFSIADSVGISGTLTLQDSGTFSANLLIQDSAVISGEAIFHASAHFSGMASFLNSVGMSGTLTVQQSAVFSNAITVITSALFSGPVSFVNSTGFSALVQFGGSTVMSGPVSFGSGIGFSTVFSPVSFESAVTVSDLDVAGVAVFALSVFFSDVVCFASGFNLTGSTTISGKAIIVSVLQANGALIFAFSTLVGPGSGILDDNDHIQLADASGGNISMQLPPASTNSGVLFRVKRTDAGANAVTVSVVGGDDTIDGSAAQDIGNKGSITIFSDNTTWHVMETV
jgi:hypothetical protein